MQTAVVELARMGSLPMSAGADPKVVERWQNLLAAVKTPISDDEARALVRVFGPDDCFGLAWTLLHLIETAPNWPLNDCLSLHGSEWIECLRVRAENAGYSCS